MFSLQVMAYLSNWMFVLFSTYWFCHRHNFSSTSKLLQERLDLRKRQFCTSQQNYVAKFLIVIFVITTLSCMCIWAGEYFYKTKNTKGGYSVCFRMIGIFWVDLWMVRYDCGIFRTKRLLCGMNWRAQVSCDI